MKVEMEFQGLQELLKAFEDAASDAEIAEVNRKIVEKGEPVVKKIMSGKIPKSADIKKVVVVLVRNHRCLHMLQIVSQLVKQE